MTVEKDPNLFPTSATFSGNPSLFVFIFHSLFIVSSHPIHFRFISSHSPLYHLFCNCSSPDSSPLINRSFGIIVFPTFAPDLTSPSFFCKGYITLQQIILCAPFSLITHCSLSVDLELFFLDGFLIFQVLEA